MRKENDSRIYKSQIILKKNLSERNYPLLLKWLSDKSIIGYLYSARRMVNFKTVRDVKKFLAEEKDEIFWEICANNGKFIGYTSLCGFKNNQCEFSVFILDKKYWGKGIGGEVTRLMLDFAFDELKMKKVVLETSEHHQSAIKLYERIGFKKRKYIPNDRTIFHRGKWILSGSVIMSINKKNYDNQSQKMESTFSQNGFSKIQPRN
jgi:RimJ/RimL family protein N-acetyltransferase